MENVHERNGMLVYWSWFQISASQTKEFSGSDKDTTRQIIAPPKGLPTLTAVGSMQRHPPGALKAEKVDWMMTNDWEGSKPFPTSPDVQCDLPRNLPKMKAMISESKAAQRIVWFIIVMVVCDRTILYDHQRFGTRALVQSINFLPTLPVSRNFVVAFSTCSWSSSSSRSSKAVAWLSFIRSWRGCSHLLLLMKLPRKVLWTH